MDLHFRDILQESCLTFPAKLRKRRSNNRGGAIHMTTPKKLLEIVQRHLTHFIIVKTPKTIGALQFMNSTLFPPDHCLSMEKVGISVPKSDPFFSGFLIPENLLLLKNLPILSPAAPCQ